MSISISSTNLATFLEYVVDLSFSYMLGFAQFISKLESFTSGGTFCVNILIVNRSESADILTEFLCQYRAR